MFMVNKKNRLMNWHKLLIISFCLIIISAILPPNNLIHVISAIVGFSVMIIGIVAASHQGMNGKKYRAGEKDSTKAYLVAVMLCLVISFIYGHFFEFSIFDHDIFSWLKF